MKTFLLLALAVLVAAGASACSTYRGDAVVILDADYQPWDRAAMVAGMTYDGARTKLRQAGIQPVAQPHDRASLMCDDDFCSQYPEAIACSEDRLGNCSFAWLDTRIRTYLIVQTYGQGDLTVGDVRVASADEAARLSQAR